MTSTAAPISSTLLDWYDRHARALPWRNPPGAAHPRDPAFAYRVWLSEVMLQQTTVSAVIPYFEAFMRRWPNVEALAAAPEDEIMAAWAGLGYYSRARNLVKAAREVSKQGGFPSSEQGLRELPGLGAYTAAAIAAIAFDQRAVVVDANVERVVARLFAIEEPLPRARKSIRAAADTITPAQRVGDFAQAMMDLGARICTPRNPRCADCPLGALCQARLAGDPGRLPVRPPKKVKPQRRGTAWWIEREQKVWLVRRPGRGMLGGMLALPDDGWSAHADGSRVAPLDGAWQSRGRVAHGFTHFALELEVRQSLVPAQPEGEGAWWPIDRIEEAGLPTLFRKAAARALAG